MSEFTYSDVRITRIESIAPYSPVEVSDEFDEINDIEVQTSGSSVIYQIEGLIDSDTVKKIIILNGELMSSYFIYTSGE